jgi:hypothetical protein
MAIDKEWLNDLKSELISTGLKEWAAVYDPIRNGYILGYYRTFDGKPFAAFKKEDIELAAKIMNNLPDFIDAVFALENQYIEIENKLEIMKRESSEDCRN